MRQLVIFAVLLGSLVATPALARPRCDANDMDSGFRIEFGFGFGKMTTKDTNSLDMMRIKKLGVDVVSTRRTTDGCIEAQVRNEDGSWNVQYYDEDTLVLVQD